MIHLMSNIAQAFKTSTKTVKYQPLGVEGSTYINWKIVVVQHYPNRMTRIWEGAFLDFHLLISLTMFT